MTFSEFIKSTDWPHTLQLAGTRIAAAAVILTVLSFKSSEPFWRVIPNLFEWLMVLSIFMGLAIPAYFLAKSESTWWGGLLGLPAWLVCVADPALKFLQGKRPDLVPVDGFKWILNPPLIHIEKNPEFENDQSHFGLPDPQNSYRPSSSSSSGYQNDFERGKQLFNRGEQKDGLEMVAGFADSNPNHIEANLFMSRELVNADIEGFSELIRKYIQNVLRSAPSNEEARRILDRLNHTGQSESANPPQQSTINLAKVPDDKTTSGTGQIVRVDWDAFQSAYQRGSSDQKAWVDSEEAGLLASKLVEEASLDSQSTNIRAGLIRVISNYYLRLIQQHDLAGHIQVEAQIGSEAAALIAPKIVESVRPV